MNPGPGLNCPFYPIVMVKAVDASGEITDVGNYNGGMCFAFPTSGYYTFSGGTGTGYTVPAGQNGVRWYIPYASVSGGSGYTAPPTVAFQPSQFSTPSATAMLTDTAKVAPVVPQGGPTAGTQGTFGATVPWPINPVHMAMLPDGRILNYGSDPSGSQFSALIYDIWDPSLGTGLESHLVLPNVTSTDIFCSNTSVIWSTGQVLMTGGDLTVKGVRNYANNKTTIFNPAANAISSGGQMQYPRWYPSVVSLPNGEKLTLGGYVTRALNLPLGAGAAPTPEVYNPITGWRSLSGVNSWNEPYYPRAFLAPSGNIVGVQAAGPLFSLSTAGNGTLQRFSFNAPLGYTLLPTLMFTPGKLLSVRKSAVVVIDFTGPTPTVTPTANLDQMRYDASGTLMADGEVLINGGSAVDNVLSGVAYTAQIWNPATGSWTTGAAATKPRLYHSNALLMADGSVLTAGGGSPGPITNLNAEIYFPPYLYTKDGSGNPAPRPVILSTQAEGGVPVGQSFGLTMADASPISRVTMLRFGAATHTTNIDQRFIDLTPTLVQNGQQLSVTLPANPNVALSGYYLVFAFNQAGVPSIATQILVTN
jgi:hypothetical protein